MAIKKHLGLRGKALNLSLLCTAVLPAYLLYGYNQVVAGGLVAGLPTWDATFPAIDTDNTKGPQKVENALIQGTVVGIYTAAGIFGSLFCIWSADKLGRRRTIAIGAAAAAIGATLQCSAYSLPHLIVGRVIAGLGNGGIVATVPTLQSETSAPAKRGAVVQWLSVFALAGLALAAWIELGTSFAPGSVSWRFPLAFPIFLALLIIGAMTFTPESPRWLVMSGRADEAREVMSALYDVETDSDLVNTEVTEIQKSMEISGPQGFSDCFKMGKNRALHRTCICCGIQMFQQLSGVNCLAYYETTIFLDLGLSNVDARILAAAVFTFSALVSTLGVFTVDRFGRRPLLLISVIGNGICMAIIAGTSSQTSNQVALGFAVLCVFLFFFFFPVGFLGVTFLYAAEAAPDSLRGPITAMSTATVWAFNFMAVEVTPVGLQTISYKFYIIWAVMNLFFILPCVYFFFPETKGLSLEQIDGIFTRSKNAFEPVWIAKKVIKGEVSADQNGSIDPEKEVHKEVRTEED